MKKFKTNFKTLAAWVKIGYKDKVDLAMLLIAIALTVADLFTGADIRGGYGFLTVYIFAAIVRMGWWKDACNKYVTEEEFREKLGLPKL